jgi:hypothetical protein
MTDWTPGFEEEKQDIVRWFRKTLLRSAVIIGGLIAEVTISLFTGVWALPAALFGIWKLLPAAITAVIGETRLFPKRTTLNLYGRSLWLWAILSEAGLILTVIFPFSITSIVGASIPFLLAQLLSVSGFTVLSLLSTIRQLRRRVEVDIPNWARAGLWGAEGIMGEVVWNLDILKKLQGMPIAIINRTNRPLVMTMVWLEWFAYLPWIPKGFQRQYGGGQRETYHRKIIMLGESTTLKPNDAKIWVLTFEEAGAFYNELKRRKMVGREMVYAHITIYDEYTDRVRGSRMIPLQTAWSPIFKEFL